MRTTHRVMLCLALVAIQMAVASLRCHADANGELVVSTDFPGGSATIHSVDSSTATIHFSPGGDANNGWVCWWSLKVSNLQVGQRLVLLLSPSDQLTRNNGRLAEKPLDAAWSMPRQASVSMDGRTWQHTAPGTRKGPQMHYEVIATASTLWLAWGPPFTTLDTEALLDLASQKVPRAAKFELAKTRQDRPVMAVRTQAPQTAAPRPGIWIQARQHAWESGSSWVARGLVEWLIEQGPSAQWLIDHAELVIVPIMDVDNVTTGNGGKEADPRDHNRDWDDMPVYPEVRAAQKQLLDWAQQQRMELFIDLHNPAPGDARPFFFCGPPDLLSQRARNHRALFLGIAQRHISGPLKIDPVPRITGPSYHPLWRQISGQWVTDHGNEHTQAICLETAWNTPHSTTEGYRIVGTQLGETIVEYVKRRVTTD